MRPRENDARMRDDDRALCVAYIDGLLTQDEQLAFEQRLAADPGLAARVRALLETDELLRAAQLETAREAQRATRLRPLAWIVSLAAAAALLVWLAVAMLGKPAAPNFEVALAPSFESAREFAAQQPTLADLAPPGLAALRGGVAEPNVAAERFVELAEEAEARIVQSALAADRAELVAPFFVLPIRLAAPSEVVVFALADDGPPARLYPDAAATSATLSAGAQLLPSTRFERVGDGDSARVRYRRGFLMPVGVAELFLVVGVREVVAGDAPRELSLERAALEPDRASLQEALRREGFATQLLVVRAPR